MDDLPLSRNGLKSVDVAVKAIRNAGEYVRNNFLEDKIVKIKGRSNLVSNVDFESEKIIIDVLKNEYPDWDMISEESYPDNKSENYAWVIDPIDGTTNFIHSIPFIAVNIALKYKDIILLGLTYDPLRDELFLAQRGNGAYLNDKRLEITEVSDIGKAIVSCDLGYDFSKGDYALKIFHKLWGKALCLRLLGSAALGMAYVACKRINLYFHQSVYPWDITSGKLLVEEAGGIVKGLKTIPSGANTISLVASNKKLVEQFIDIAKNI
jgi:myo-inositol-1(or 4)-monophosphatase